MPSASASDLSAPSAVFSRRGTRAPLSQGRPRGRSRHRDALPALSRSGGSGRGRLRGEDDPVRGRLRGGGRPAAATEPWQAFVDYVHFLLQEQVDDPGFWHVLIAPLSGSAGFAAQHRRALNATTALVERVVEARVVREGFSHSDLYLLTLANTGLIRASRSTRVAASRRLGALHARWVPASLNRAASARARRVKRRSARGATRMTGSAGQFAAQLARSASRSARWCRARRCR